MSDLWEDLSDDELASRLAQHLPNTGVTAMIAIRDTEEGAELIGRVLDGDDA